MWLRRAVLTVIAGLLFLHGMPLCNGHGVSKHTPITTDRGTVCVHKIYEEVSLQNACLQSCVLAENEEISSSACFKSLSAIARGIADTYMHIVLSDEHICCTPQQPFYVPARGGWIFAGQLYEGDELLTVYGKTACVTSISIVDKPLEVYALEVEDTHVFCVGRGRVLTHNIALPIALGGGFECILGASITAGSLGATLGPLAILGGLMIGGIVAAVTQHAFSHKRAPDYVYTSPIIDLNAYRAQHKAGLSFESFGPLPSDTVSGGRTTTSNPASKNPLHMPSPCWCGHSCKADCVCDCGCGCKKPITFFQNNEKHIFRKDDGHVIDTPENRQTLLDMVANAANALGLDQFGNQWFALSLSDGRQAWAIVRDGKIRDGGINDWPHEFNQKTGLSNPVKPGR